MTEEQLDAMEAAARKRVAGMMQTTVDWPEVLGDIGGQDGTLALSKRLGVSRGTVRGWLAGAEPRHAEGERLIAIWMQGGKGREELPRTTRVLSADKIV